MYYGDTVTVSIYAQTGANELQSFGLQLFYNTSALSYSSTASSYFSSPTVNTVADGSSSYYVATTAALAGAPSAGFFEILSVSFSVLPAAAGTSQPLSLYASELGNAAGLAFCADSTGSPCAGALLSDARGGWFSTGLLDVAAPVLVGAYASTAKPTLTNTLPLNGEAVTTSVAGYGAYGITYTAARAALYPWASPLTPAACTSSDTALLAASPVAGGCAVAILASGDGASDVSVDFSTASGLSASASFQVYQLTGAYAEATRYTLRRLGCGYETSTLFAYASLPLVGASPIATVDISTALNWTSSNTSVASVVGRLVTGVGAGSVRLLAEGLCAPPPSRLRRRTP